MARIFLDRHELGDDIRQLLGQIRDAAAGAGAAGECSPPCDVIETPAAIEVLVDLPGVAADSINVLFSRHTLVVAGQKLPAACGHGHPAFQLAERTFGRFVRAIRLTGACDAGRAEATLRAGELRITLPRIDDRRGREIPIAVRVD
jgi:HSP20 family protein